MKFCSTIIGMRKVTSRESWVMSDDTQNSKLKTQDFMLSPFTFTR